MEGLRMGNGRAPKQLPQVVLVLTTGWCVQREHAQALEEQGRQAAAARDALRAQLAEAQAQVAEVRPAAESSRQAAELAAVALAAAESNAAQLRVRPFFVDVVCLWGGEVVTMQGMAQGQCAQLLTICGRWQGWLQWHWPPRGAMPSSSRQDYRQWGCFQDAFGCTDSFVELLMRVRYAGHMECSDDTAMLVRWGLRYRCLQMLRAVSANADDEATTEAHNSSMMLA